MKLRAIFIKNGVPIEMSWKDPVQAVTTVKMMRREGWTVTLIQVDGTKVTLDTYVETGGHACDLGSRSSSVGDGCRDDRNPDGGLRGHDLVENDPAK